MLHAPWQTITIAAAILGLLGLGGLAYTVIVVRRMRKQVAYKPIFEDWLFHVALPLGAYAILALSAFAAGPYERRALFGVGGWRCCCFSSASTMHGTESPTTSW